MSLSSPKLPTGHTSSTLRKSATDTSLNLSGSPVKETSHTVMI